MESHLRTLWVNPKDKPKVLLQCRRQGVSSEHDASKGVYVIELTGDDWAKAVQWRPYVYKRIAAFGRKVLARGVSFSGEFGESSFQWNVSGYAYGVEARSILEDLEAPALEAAARAAHRFDESRGTKFVTYLSRAVDNALRETFDSWVKGSSSEVQRPIEWAEDLEAPPLLPEESSLDPETEEALQEAMGALTSKEAWALRMYADGVPIQVIQERMGHDRDTSTHALIKRARQKAERAFGKAREAQ